MYRLGYTWREAIKVHAIIPALLRMHAMHAVRPALLRVHAVRPALLRVHAVRPALLQVQAVRSALLRPSSEKMCNQQAYLYLKLQFCIPRFKGSWLKVMRLNSAIEEKKIIS
jgi:hypothetical protein